MLIGNRIFISCYVGKVWMETINVEDWPSWTPTVQTVLRLETGVFGVGSEARIKQPLQPSAIWRVTAFESESFFAWETAGKLFRMRATHRVDPYAGGTVCRLTVELVGPLAILLGPLLRFPLQMALKRENQGLKCRCEASDNSHLPKLVSHPAPFGRPLRTLRFKETAK